MLYELSLFRECYILSKFEYKIKFNPYFASYQRHIYFKPSPSQGVFLFDSILIANFLSILINCYLHLSNFISHIFLLLILLSFISLFSFSHRNNYNKIEQNNCFNSDKNNLFKKYKKKIIFKNEK